MVLRLPIRLAVAGLLSCVWPHGDMPALLAQTAGVTASSSANSNPATRALLDKAHTLEASGRLDLASQAWEQVLVSSPDNTEALTGLARAAKLSGNGALATTYLNRLRMINPNDPNIARIQSLMSQQNQTQQLQQAGTLAQNSQYDAAMKIYRQVFGVTPPPGDWALAYYETEAAATNGRAHAITGLRELVKKFPSDSRYQIALGRILTYDPKTRAEGRAYLQRHPANPAAMEALRQSFL